MGLNLFGLIFELVILHLLLKLGSAAPLENDKSQDNAVEMQVDDSLQSKAGLGDIFKPQNILNGLNGTNSANNLIPNNPPFNIMKDAKLLLLSAQGVILPIDTVSNGFVNFITGLGNNMQKLFNNQNISLKLTV